MPDTHVQYYQDEAFYDATIVKKTKTGWMVAFDGFEDEPQDTEVRTMGAL